jgi:hypothetical protein
MGHIVVIEGRSGGFFGAWCDHDVSWRSRFLAAGGLASYSGARRCCESGQGDGITVRAGLQLGDGEHGKVTWHACGARRARLQ